MTTMPDVAGGWLRSLLGALGGDFGRDILYLGVAGYSYTHLGCFGARGGAGGGAKSLENGFHQSGLPN
jgi:hypothetical protein